MEDHPVEIFAQFFHAVSNGAFGEPALFVDRSNHKIALAVFRLQGQHNVRVHRHPGWKIDQNLYGAGKKVAAAGAAESAVQVFLDDPDAGDILKGSTGFPGDVLGDQLQIIDAFSVIDAWLGNGLVLT